MTRASGEPRLRFDRVALSVAADFETALAALVDEGGIILVAITAPIRSPARTVADAVALIVEWATREPDAERFCARVHANCVRVRRSRGGAALVRVIVHNPEPSPNALLDRLVAGHARE